MFLRSHQRLACSAFCLFHVLGCYPSTEMPAPAGGYSKERVEYESPASFAITEEHTVVPESVRRVQVADMFLAPDSPCKINEEGLFSRNEELCFEGRLLRNSKSKTPAVIFIDIFHLTASKNTSINRSTIDPRLRAVTMGTTNRPTHNTDSLHYRVRVKIPADPGKYRLQARVITNPNEFPGIVVGEAEFTVR